MAIIDKASLAFEADPAKHTEKAGESAPIAPSTANPPAINTQTVFKSLKDVDKPGRLAKLEQVRLSNAAIDEEKRLPVSPENEEEPSPIQHKEETGQHDIPQKIEAEKQKEKALQRSDVFEKIYSSNSWRSKETKSGSGSELIHSVQARKMIEFVIDKFKIKSWVDAPCGDFNWQHHVSNFARVNYTGLDIVPEAILDNSRKHMADLPNARFANVDLVTTRNLPYADLYLVRDVIQHLPLEDGMQIFRNVAASGAKYLLTNMHVRKSDGQPFPNQDIGAGLYYFNNPTMEPFNFPEPLYYIRDTNENFLGTIASHREIKLLGLWELDERGLLGLGTGKGLQIDWQQAGNNIVRRRGG